MNPDEAIVCQHENFEQLDEFESECFNCKCLDCGETFVKIIKSEKVA